jgi:hypothetical protein
MIATGQLTFLNFAAGRGWGDGTPGLDRLAQSEFNVQSEQR